MDNITIGQLTMWLATATALFGGIAYFVKPITSLVKRVEKIEEHQESEKEKFAKYDTDLKQVLLSVNVLLSHSIDNNHTAQLKQRKEELDKYLISR